MNMMSWYSMKSGARYRAAIEYLAKSSASMKAVTTSMPRMNRTLTNQ